MILEYCGDCSGGERASVRGGWGWPSLRRRAHRADVAGSFTATGVRIEARALIDLPRSGEGLPGSDYTASRQ